MRAAGRIAAEVLAYLRSQVRPGACASDLDRMAREEILRRGATPAFLGYRGFPAAVCVSVNCEVVHGIPSAQKIFRSGDIVSLDFGVLYEGYYGDTALSVGVGEVPVEVRRLMEVTEEALQKAISVSYPGNRLGDIGHIIQGCAHRAGLSVVRDFVGHGIGRNLHEEPQVLNYGAQGTGLRLVEGMVLAIEPMFNLGTSEVAVLEDGWTVVTCDGRPSAHFEHTVAITEQGPEVLTKI